MGENTALLVGGFGGSFKKVYLFIEKGGWCREGKTDSNGQKTAGGTEGQSLTITGEKDAAGLKGSRSTKKRK